MVPIAPGTTVGHLAVRFGLPILIVVRAGLGTLNHTGLTAHYARSLGLTVAGIVINQADPQTTDIAEQTNPGELERAFGLNVLGSVPVLRPEQASAADVVARYLNMNLLLG